MLLRALKVMEAALLQYLLPLALRRTGSPIVAITPPSDSGGELESPSECLGLCLVGVDQESASYGSTPRDYKEENKPLYINATVLVHANFSNYQDAVLFLSQAIGCFQWRSSFRPEEFPDLDFPGDLLRLEPLFPSPDQASGMWQMFGATMRPSMLYRCKTLRYHETMSLLRAPKPPVSGLAGILKRFRF